MATAAAEWVKYVAPPFVGRAEVGYCLVELPGGIRFPLRVGMTAIGRYRENDIVLTDLYVSRRHCVLLVHTNSGCEVFDTASRNGTRVNGRSVSHAWLNVGDVLELYRTRFVLADEDGSGAEDRTRG
jgi:pSer/pThr/pTyr-binding forkhead associated (FHA) protein